MGSRSTKVAALPHVKAVALPVAPAQQHHQKSNDTNASAPCQDNAFQPASKTVTLTQPCDDITLKHSTRTNTAPRRRYSEPTGTAAMDMEPDMNVLRHLEAFETFIAERNLLAIDVDDAFVTPITFVPVEEDAGKDAKPEIQCVACCTKLPKEGDTRYAKEVIKPCRLCNSAYCISCVKNMFLSACKDLGRMPPRCCTQLHLHHIKPHLTMEEITEYRLKYEEWSTPKPFYCPVPTCSVFIPTRLLPQQTELNKKRIDSGVGAPTSASFQCPQCESSICIDCRQIAHADSLCAALDLGVDAETAALLKSWGYKRCPKCGQGLKRMYGCNHMECRCGAHFCWACMQSRDDCEGSCNEDEDDDDDEDEEEDYGSDSEHNDSEVLSRPDDITPDERSTITTREIDAADEETATQAAARDTTDGPSTSRPNSRPRNLDGGPAHYWAQLDLDFGEEPSDDIQDVSWDCRHSFQDYRITLTEALSTSAMVSEMECVRCWCAIQPVIVTPPDPESTSGASKAPRTVAGRGRGGRRGRGRGVAARLRPTPYVPPRGLARSDAVVGTASHLTARLLLHMRPRTSEARSDPMEGVQSGSDTDTKAILTTSDNETALSKKAISNIFSSQSPTLRGAKHCYTCGLLVCSTCASSIKTEQGAEPEPEPEHTVETNPEEDIGRLERPLHSGEVSAPSDVDEQPPSSLLD